MVYLAYVLNRYLPPAVEQFKDFIIQGTRENFREYILQKKKEIRK